MQSQSFPIPASAVNLMGSPRQSKAKGREAERAVVAYLIAQGWPYTERRRLSGSSDRGDIAGIAGVRGAVTVEVKDRKAVDLAGAVNELMTEMANTGDGMGFAVIKRRGFPWRAGDPSTHDAPGHWYGVLPVRLLVQLLKEAGYQ